MITKTKKKGVTIYHVSPVLTDAQTTALIHTHLKPKQISTIIDEDADVYTEDGELLLIFRKNKLSPKYVQQFYDNVISFAMNVTSNRMTASGFEKGAKTRSNILGYFDTLAPGQKRTLRDKGFHYPHSTIRQTRFSDNYPEKFQAAIPLIQEIDKYYKQYVPDKYKLQKKKAMQTPFRIKNTSFTTITTNVNFQTAVHEDRGDDREGFGNLSVIEHGEYTGGETCFPQYGIGVNVRTGDVLYMNVHKPHGNLPVVLKTPDSIRLSIVCYLREKIWHKSKGKSKKYMERHLKTLKRALRNK